MGFDVDSSQWGLSIESLYNGPESPELPLHDIFWPLIRTLCLGMCKVRMAT